MNRRLKETKNNMKLTKEEERAYSEIKRHLKAGATIRAYNPKGDVLEPKGENQMYWGLVIDYPIGNEGVAIQID